MSQITFKQGTTTRMTTTKQYDLLGNGSNRRLEVDLYASCIVSLPGFSWACIQWCSIGFRLLEVPIREEILAVNINNNNILPSVAPIRHVANGARILHSHRARHERKVTNRPATSSTMNNLAGWTNLRFDPLPEAPEFKLPQADVL